MTHHLPPNLLQLFAPRPTLRWVPAVDLPPEKRFTPAIDGVAAFVDSLKEYKELDDSQWVDCEDPEIQEKATKEWTDSEHQRRVNKRLEKQERQKKLINEDTKDFDPSKDPKVQGDPMKTLFVGRLSYKVEKRDLEKEFGRYGPITRIRLVKDERPEDEQDEDGSTGSKKKSKPHRGYAFIEYEKERDSKVAYQQCNGIRILDRPVVVDVERGRTVEGWLPTRLGGGKGGRHYTRAGPRPGQFGGYQGAPPGPGFMRGGFRGGRGGFDSGRSGFDSGRGGFDSGSRGGGGFRGGRGGFDRGGYGGGGGFGGPRGGGFAGSAPEGAPAGPRGGRGGGFGGYGGRSSDGPRAPYGGYEQQNGYSRGGGGGGYGPGASGSNAEPVAPRSRDQPYIKGEDHGSDPYARRDDYSRKRQGDYNDYDDHRSKRRY